MKRNRKKPKPNDIKKYYYKKCITIIKIFLLTFYYYNLLIHISNTPARKICDSWDITHTHTSRSGKVQRRIIHK